MAIEPLRARTYTEAERGEQRAQTARSYSTGEAPFGFLPAAPGTPARFGPHRYPAGGIPTPEFDVLTQSYVDPRTGMAWTGDIPGGLYAKGGKIAPKPQSQAATAAPDTAPKLITTVEQPKLAAIADKAYADQPAQAAATQTAFGDWLGKLEAAKKTTGGVIKQQAADTSATENRINTEINKFETGATASVNRAEQALQNLKNQQAALNAAQRANNALEAQNVRAIAGQAYGRNIRGANAVAVANPLNSVGDSGYDRGNRARYFNEAYIPAEQRIRQLESGVLATEQGQAAQNYANEQNFINFDIGMQDRFKSDEVGAAQYIQGLKTQLAQLPLEMQFRFLAYDNEIPGLSQRLRSGELSIADAIGMLERKSKDYTYTEPYDPSRIPPTTTANFPINQPGRTYGYSAQPSAGPLSGGSRTVSPVRGTREYDSAVMSNPAMDWARYAELRAGRNPAAATASLPGAGRLDFSRAYMMEQAGDLTPEQQFNLDQKRRYYENLEGPSYSYDGISGPVTTRDYQGVY